MSTRTDEWLENHRFELEDWTRALLRIPSVQGPAIAAAPMKPAPQPGFPPTPAIPPSPFGKNVRNCEDYAIKFAKMYLGLKAADNEGYYAVVDAGEEEGVEKEMLGILCHLDVVPEGTGWITEPYASNFIGNKIYGRGAIDDKGPAMASIFALKAVVDCGYKFKRQVRIILGCNEETGMECIKYYKEHDRIPDVSFSPDGAFPVCNSEKGIAHASFAAAFTSAIKFNAGIAPNVVPGTAHAEVALDEKLIAKAVDAWQAENPDYKISANGTAIDIIGKQAHASLPEGGFNALQAMVRFLATLPIEGDDAAHIANLNKVIGTGYYGEGFGLDTCDDSGRQTINVGLIEWNENGYNLTLDLRCPTSVPEDTIKAALEKAFEGEASIEGWNYSEGLYVPEDSELVSKLVKVYQDRTGDLESKPVKMGGGTYARTLPNAVSFGPEGYMCEAECHVANEYITREELMFLAKIIADAIIALACEE